MALKKSRNGEGWDATGSFYSNFGFPHAPCFHVLCLEHPRFADGLPAQVPLMAPGNHQEAEWCDCHHAFIELIKSQHFLSQKSARKKLMQPCPLVIPEFSPLILA